MSKELGKISSAKVGFGEEGRFGFWLQFEGNGMSVGWQMVYFPDNVNDDLDSIKGIGIIRFKILHEIQQSLKLAKKKSVSELVGIPVEIEFDGMVLKSWRVLTEVL